MRQWYAITAAQGVLVSGRLCQLYGLLRMTTSCMSSSRDELDAIFKQKQVTRTQFRKTLKAIDPSLRSQQDNAVQDISRSALREVDTFKLLSNILRPQSNMCREWKIKNSHMRMLNISCVDDLVANLMDILEPDPVDADGQAMLASTLIPQPYSVNHSFHEEDGVLSHILKDNFQSKERVLRIEIEAPMQSLGAPEPLMHRMVKYLASIKSKDGKSNNTSENSYVQAVILKLLVTWLADCHNAITMQCTAS